MIDLDSIQSMWLKDSSMDMDNLHEESTLKTNALHAKYFEIYNNIQLLKKKAEQQKKNIRHQRYEYYSCLLYTSPSPRDKRQSRMPSSA